MLQLQNIFKITLLSNTCVSGPPHFYKLQNYTTLKLIGAINFIKTSFRGLQNYTTLKPRYGYVVLYNSFRGLQNYTTLKPLNTNN